MECDGWSAEWSWQGVTRIQELSCPSKIMRTASETEQREAKGVYPTLCIKYNEAKKWWYQSLKSRSVQGIMTVVKTIRTEGSRRQPASTALALAPSGPIASFSVDCFPFPRQRRKSRLGACRSGVPGRQLPPSHVIDNQNPTREPFNWFQLAPIQAFKELLPRPGTKVHFIGN